MLYTKFYKTATTGVNMSIVDLGEIGGKNLPASPAQMELCGYSNMQIVKGSTDAWQGKRPKSLDDVLSAGQTLYSTPTLTYGITKSNTTHHPFITTHGNNSVDRYSTYSQQENPTYLAVASVNGVRYLGFLVIGTGRIYSGGSWHVYPDMWCFLATTSGASSLSIMLIQMRFTDEVGNTADVDGIGNDDASYDFTGDQIALPDEPDETISGALTNGFFNVYSPSANQIKNFGGALWTNAFNVKWYDLDSISNLVLNAVSDPINFIVGLFMIPITPDTTSSNGIYLGGINVDTVKPPRISKQFKKIDFGSIAIDELYGNYLDYAHSGLSIYLPYIGTADIDIQEVNGGTVSLQYIVDCFTGACVANVRCQKTTATPWGESYTNETVHSYSGNCAIQLPISAGSFDTLMQGLINVGLGLGTNTPAVAMQGGNDIIQGFAGDVTTRGSLSSNTGKLCYQTPYLMFTRPIESRPDKLGKLHGYSAGVGGKLNQFSGYVECSDVKLDGVTATESELAEIESLLKSGVYV